MTRLKRRLKSSGTAEATLVYAPLSYQLLVYAALSYQLLVYAALSYQLLVYAALSYQLLVYAALSYQLLVYAATLKSSGTSEAPSKPKKTVTSAPTIRYS